MIIKKAEFIISAVERHQYPDDNRNEVAFVGRSNVGKSSLINTIVNRRGLVKVSGVPGKTRLINFFLINDDFYFVDLPGYGYAKVSKVEKEKWGKILEKYLVSRDTLKKIVLLVDSRHKPTADDILMYNYIKYHGYQIIVAATKIDKLSNNELSRNIKIIRETLDLEATEKIIKFSSLKKIGVEELLAEFDDMQSSI